jgi:hypothetical protein
MIHIEDLFIYLFIYLFVYFWFIYLFVCLFVYLFILPRRCDPTQVMASSFLRFLDHKQRRTTFARTPLDE